MLSNLQQIASLTQFSRPTSYVKYVLWVLCGLTTSRNAIGNLSSPSSIGQCTATASEIVLKRRSAPDFLPEKCDKGMENPQGLVLFIILLGFLSKPAFYDMLMKTVPHLSAAPIWRDLPDFHNDSKCNNGSRAKLTVLYSVACDLCAQSRGLEKHSILLLFRTRPCTKMG